MTPRNTTDSLAAMENGLKFGDLILGASANESFPVELKSVPEELCLRAQPFF